MLKMKRSCLFSFVRWTMGALLLLNIPANNSFKFTTYALKSTYLANQRSPNRMKSYSGLCNFCAVSSISTEKLNIIQILNQKIRKSLIVSNIHITLISLKLILHKTTKKVLASISLVLYFFFSIPTLNSNNGISVPTSPVYAATVSSFSGSTFDNNPNTPSYDRESVYSPRERELPPRLTTSNFETTMNNRPTMISNVQPAVASSISINDYKIIGFIFFTILFPNNPNLISKLIRIKTGNKIIDIQP